MVPGSYNRARGHRCMLDGVQLASPVEFDQFSLNFGPWVPKSLKFDLKFGFYIKMSSLGTGSEVPILAGRPKHPKNEKIAERLAKSFWFRG